MKIEIVKVEDLKPAEYNPRKISDKVMEDLKATIQQYGLVEPLVVNKDMTLVGGHQRLRAAKELGMKEVPCYFIDVDKEAEKKLNLALNKITGEFDFAKLTEFSVETLKSVGFADFEISAIFDDFEIPDAEVGIDKKESLNEYLMIVCDGKEEAEEMKTMIGITGKQKAITFKEFKELWLAKTDTPVQG